jgi:hypothetical protein
VFTCFRQCNFNGIASLMILPKIKGDESYISNQDRHNRKARLNERLMMEKAKLADHTSGHHKMDDEEVLRVRKHIEALEQTLRREPEGYFDAHEKRREAMRSMLDNEKSKLADHVNGKKALGDDELKALRKKIEMLEHRVAHEHMERGRRERYRPDRGMEL